MAIRTVFHIKRLQVAGDSSVLGGIIFICKLSCNGFQPGIPACGETAACQLSRPFGEPFRKFFITVSSEHAVGQGILHHRMHQLMSNGRF